MARIRSVKPELRTSLTVAEWPREVRYAWVLLWGYLDDHGRGVDDARLVKADCLPLDDDITAAVMDAWLEMFAAAGSLCRYTVGNRRFMHIPEWGEHQKPQHPKPTQIPPCPKCSGGEPSGSPHEDLMKSSGERQEVLTPEMEGEMEREGEKSSRSGAEKPSRGDKRRATRIADDFAVTTELAAWAREHTPDVDSTRETIKFVNHWRAKSGQDATKVDWSRTWQNWMIRSQEYAEERSTRASPNGAAAPDYHQPYIPEARR
jgi:hypothetical protein